ncbi:iron chelate uptake ABC transporter family permease subunit [Poseidonibacter sp.]|uniref:iron chelate uptake ABC transporter family permease subunit n=1 Tax=Poseidonibacter sp. TaxID=2321188 RepID=UPI003C70F6BC
MQVRAKLLILGSIFFVGLAFFMFWGINASNYEFFLPRRFSKVLAIFVVAYAVGFSAVIFQTITNNKILTPSIMGLDSLYLFIQTFVVFFFGSSTLVMMSDAKEFVLSVSLMILASLLLYKLLFKGTNKNIYFLVLAGMILGTLFDGMATFMQVLLDPNEFLVLQGKMFASFNTINSELLYICLAISFIVILLSLKDFAKLDVLSLGENDAINLGIDYKAIVKRMLVYIAILTSIATVLVGPITFLGILLVSISRQMLNSFKHSYMTIGAVLIGNIALIYSLIIVERVFNNETTVSILINFVGVLYFIYLILKESKRD